MTTAKSLIGVCTIAVGVGFASPALCEDNDADKKGTDKTTTARTPVEVKSTETVAGHASKKVAGWPRSGEDEASGDPWGAALAIFGVLSAAGVSSIFLRKRKKPAVTADVIEVLATKHVAPRTKIVLLSTRHREVLISVGQDGATLLTEWLSDDSAPVRSTPPSLPHRREPAVAFDDALDEAGPESEALLELARAPQVPEAAKEAAAETRPSAAEYRGRGRADSEAVAGLLALRHRQGGGVMTSQVDTLETDSGWSKRLMKQMRASGGRS